MFQYHRPERSSSVARMVLAQRESVSVSCALNLKRIACDPSRVATTTAWRRNYQSVRRLLRLAEMPYVGVLRKNPLRIVTRDRFHTIREDAILQRSAICRAAL